MHLDIFFQTKKTYEMLFAKTLSYDTMSVFVFYVKLIINIVREINLSCVVISVFFLDIRLEKMVANV